eukprot:gb/GECH01003587.1/.p1 GENE.gb/GECH01003587.1/~~gb/GECH01003587.1/.p1  ORF type:complete len:354 (+),score=70.13 gb/GECH01003587.1/:1-1062(+)
MKRELFQKEESYEPLRKRYRSDFINDSITNNSINYNADDHYNHKNEIRNVSFLSKNWINDNLIFSYTRWSEFQEAKKHYNDLVKLCLRYNYSLIAEVGLNLDHINTTFRIMIRFNDNGRIESTHCENCSRFLWCSHVASVLFFVLYHNEQIINYNDFNSFMDNSTDSQIKKRVFTNGNPYENLFFISSFLKSNPILHHNSSNISSLDPDEFNTDHDSPSISSLDQEAKHNEIISPSAESINLHSMSIYNELNSFHRDIFSKKMKSYARFLSGIKDHHNANLLCFFHFKHVTNQLNAEASSNPCLKKNDLAEFKSLIENWIMILLSGFEEDAEFGFDMIKYLPVIGEYGSMIDS